MRRPVPSALAAFAAGLAFAAGSAFAQTPDRGAAWQALIAEAKKHGGVETKLDLSASYVFQAPTGFYVTLTRSLDDIKHAICVISKDLNFKTCGDWELGKITYSQRAGADAPWITSDKPPGLEQDGEKGPLARLLSTFADLWGSVPHKVRRKL